MHRNLHQAQSHEILRSWQSQRNDVNHHKDFVLPIFIGNDDDSIEAIEAMPGVYRYGCNTALTYLEPLVYSFGLRAVLLFPVVTKPPANGPLMLGDNNDDDSDRESVQSINYSWGPQSNSSSTTSNDEDEDEKRLASTIVSERLLPGDDNLSNAQPVADSSGSVNPQNPFLDQDEEEKDHLLGGGQKIDDETKTTTMTRASKIAPVPPPPPRRAEKNLSSLRAKNTKLMDKRLIKGMALKDEHNPVLRLIPKLRIKFPDLLIICDVCLCAFTSTGHCCLFEELQKSHMVSSSTLPQQLVSQGRSQYPISNKISCHYLAMLAVEYARRGCNVVAPSDMMDGRILTIREELDSHRFHQVAILSYSAKFASVFYGPFRQATNNAPSFGDRRAYQLPPGSRAMAMAAVQRDISQGADFVMVKPAGAYLDIVRDIREAHPYVPIAVYQVSGEYSMLKLAAREGILDLKSALNEVLTAYRRSGANIIISYFTPELLRGEL